MLLLLLGLCLGGGGMLLLYALCVAAANADSAMEREARVLRQRQGQGLHLVWKD